MAVAVQPFSILIVEFNEIASAKLKSAFDLRKMQSFRSLTILQAKKMLEVVKVNIVVTHDDTVGLAEFESGFKVSYPHSELVILMRGLVPRGHSFARSTGTMFDLGSCIDFETLAACFQASLSVI